MVESLVSEIEDSDFWPVPGPFQVDGHRAGALRRFHPYSEGGEV